EVYYPQTYIAPGPDPAVTQVVAQVAVKLSPEEYARAKEELVRRSKELAEAEKRVQKLKEEYDEEALEYAEMRYKLAKSKCNELSAKIKSADLWEEEQRNKAKKKIEKQKVVETHKADTAKYFHLRKVMKGANLAVEMMNFLGDITVTNHFPWPDASIKVYIVNDKAVYKKLKTKPPLICPVENICMDKKGREMLVFVDAKTTNSFQAAFNYTICGQAFDEFMELVTFKEGAGDVVRVGYCANLAKLNVVTTVDGDYDLPVLEEKKLFLASQMIDPSAIDSRERCLYYLRQAKAFTKPLTDLGDSEFTTFLKNAKGGNSRMRRNFELIRLPKEWGDGFDTFCMRLHEQAFLPLTKSK
ncbi:hypothetical protein IKS73_02480, partial [bacterium]|nr:hypothetical protein [bacterium]